jgi:excisionase family DNA binding protein
MAKRKMSLAPIAPDVKMLCRVEDAAVMLCIGRTAAWELVRKHTIKSVKIGRTRRIPLAAIQEYVQQLLEAESEVA